MRVRFTKMQGAGNDFVVLDGTRAPVDLTAAQMRRLGDRRFGEPFADFPTEDPVADTARMNRWIEEQIRANPAQYLWVHKRFKTRPPGEETLY